jgi:hypothetical protein
MINCCDELPTQFTYQDDSIKIDGCSCAIIGVEEGSIIYDYGLLVTHFMEHQGMVSEDDEFPDEQAIEWVEFNLVRALQHRQTIGINPTIRHEIEEEA